MPARLIVRFPSAPAEEHELDDGRWLIGRGDQCAVLVDHPSISRQHAALEVRDTAWQLTDLDSKNGSFHNEVRLAANQPQPVSHRDLLRFGDLACTLAHQGARTQSLDDHTVEESVNWRKRLTPGLGADNLIAESVQAILDLSGFTRGFALLRHLGGWGVVATSGITREEMAGHGFSGSLTSVRKCAETGQPIVVDRVDAAAWIGGQPSIVEGGIQSLICLPLMVNKDIIGVLYADRTQPGDGVTGLELRILESLASHAALALAVTRMERAIESLAGEIDAAAIWSAGADRADDDTLFAWKSP